MKTTRPYLFHGQGHYASVLALFALWFLVIYFVNPVGDFPLNDDWAYGRVVQSLYFGHGLQFPGEVAIPMLTQALWGLLFVSIFGFSFTVLRVSTLVLSFVAILAIYYIVCEMGLTRRKAFLSALALLLNPLFLALSFSFMSDVVFLSFSLLTVLFFLRFFHRSTTFDYSLAVTLSILTVLTRQAGLVLMLAFALGYFIASRGQGKFCFRCLLALLPLTLAYIVLFLYAFLLEDLGRLPFAYNCHLHAERFKPLVEPLSQTAKRFVDNAARLTLYLSWFVAPFLGFSFGPAIARNARSIARFALATLTGGIVFLGYCFAIKKVMPITGNILNAAGIGPLNIGSRGLRELGWDWGPFSLFSQGAGYYYLGYVSALSVLGIGLIIWVLFLNEDKFLLRPKSVPGIFPFLLVAFLFCLLPLALIDWLDRYLLLPFALLLLLFAALDSTAPAVTPWRSTVLRVLGLSFFVLPTMLNSIADTHDYLSWNRARKVALDYLVGELSIPAARIRAGHEFAMWSAYPTERPFVANRSWWYRGEPMQYQLSLNTVGDGLEEVKAVPYKRMLMRERHYLYVGKKR